MFLKLLTDWQTDRQTGRQTDRQTDKQTDRQADRQTDMPCEGTIDYKTIHVYWRLGGWIICETATGKSILVSVRVVRASGRGEAKLCGRARVVVSVVKLGRFWGTEVVAPPPPPRRNRAGQLGFTRLSADNLAAKPSFSNGFPTFVADNSRTT